MAGKAPVVILASNSFSGASLVNYLLSGGHRVIGISRSSEVNSEFKPYANNPNIKNFEFRQLDLNRDGRAIARLVNEREVETIYNFAAQSMVAQSWEYPEHWYQTNTVALAELANLLRGERSIKKFIHFTTPEVYGSTDGWIKESFEFSPSTPYAVSRAAGDWHLKCLFEAYGFPVIFTRAANVYGPGQQLYRIIPRTILSALTNKKFPLHGGGKSIRSFIHIDDVSNALESISLNGKIGDSYHISTNEMVSILELIEKIAQLLEVDIAQLVEIGPERPGKDFAYQLSSEKLRSELAWSEKIGLEAGLADMLDWAKLNLEVLKTLPVNYEHKR